MQVKILVHRRLTPDAISRRLSRRQRVTFDARVVSAPLIDLVLFQGNQVVVTSTDMLKALRRRGASAAPPVTIGYDFTLEARALIDGEKGWVFSERGEMFGWTDEMWRDIRI